MRSEDRDEILIVSGETSGEEHAAGLVWALRRRQGSPSFHFFGSGGRRMREEGVDLLLDVSDLAAIGPVAAARNLGSYWGLFRRILQRVDRRKPALAVLVDFPDFNLPLAARLKTRGIPVCYFIGPQVWAWRSSRVKHIRSYVDLMLVILPFEEEFYARHGVEAHYVGNPSAARFRREWETMEKPNRDRTREIVALLPGSRKREAELILPIQLDAAGFIAARRPVDCVVVKGPDLDGRLLSQVITAWNHKTGSGLQIEVRENSRAVFRDADCAVVKSGTSTLEAMLAGIPFAMVYRMSPTSYYFLRPFVRTGTYCLANLVAGRRIVPEFVQREARGEDVGRYLLELLENPDTSARIRRELRWSAEKLGDLDAGEEAARLILKRFFRHDEGNENNEIVCPV